VRAGELACAPVDPFAAAEDIGRALRAQTISAHEVTAAALERIEALDPRLNAFRIVLHDDALAAADAAQERIDEGDDGPLVGVPIALKDNVAQAGQVIGQGTGAYGGAEAADAELVRRLKEAGAVLVGRTHLPELAANPFTESITWGATRNPWDVTRTPGGSSGGSAVAVAAGLVPLAHATDGGGSIRVPAGYCGLFGLKPTRGLVSLAPDAEHWLGLSVSNCVARTVLDSARFLDVVADPPHPSYSDAAQRAPGTLRIAWTTKPWQPTPIHREHKRAVRETAELLSRLGHDVVEEAPSWGLILPAFLPLYLRGAADDARRLAYPERLERRTRQLVGMSRLLPRGEVERARRRGKAITARVGELFSRADVLLCPTAPYPAEPVGKWAGRSALRTMNRSAAGVVFTVPFNVTGQPAATVPAGLSADGLPLSVQLAGRPGEEETLLSLAAQLEAQRPWATTRPPLSAAGS
jgi:amidase